MPLHAIHDAYRKAFSGLPRPVWLLAFITFVNRSGTMVLPFLALYLTRQKGFSVTQAGGVLGVYGAGALGGALLGGWLCDRVEPRKIMGASLLLAGMGFLFLGFLDSRPAISLMILYLSVAGEAFRPASSTALAQCAAPGERVRAYALNRLAINLGMTFGPAAGGFLALHEYLWLFLIDGGTCALAAGLLWIFARELRPVAPPARHDTEAPGRPPWRDPPFLGLLLLVGLLALVYFQIFGTYTLTLRDLYRLSEDRIGLLLSINTLVIVLFEMILVNALRGADLLKAMGLGSFVTCVGFGLLPLGSTFLFAAFTVMAWTVGEMLSLPLIESVVADRAGERSRGRYLGMLTFAFSAAFMVAPLLGTWIYARFGAKALWYGTGALGLALWAGFHLLSGVFHASPGSDGLRMQSRRESRRP